MKKAKQKNNTIKFAHTYLKFGYPACFEGVLLEVFKAKSEDLCKQFVEFDTIYHSNNDAGVDSIHCQRATCWFYSLKATPDTTQIIEFGLQLDATRPKRKPFTKPGAAKNLM